MNEYLKVLSLRGSFGDALLFRFATERERELASRARGNLSRLAFNSHLFALRWLRANQAVQPFGPGCIFGIRSSWRRVFQQGVKTPRPPGGSFFRGRRANEGESL